MLARICNVMTRWLFCGGCLVSKANSSQVPVVDFHGINWADARDNFVDGWIIPSGIDHSKTEQEIVVQVGRYLDQFQTLLGVNALRLGINPDTVLSDSWWQKYRALIREATKRNMHVILACWESESRKEGRIDDERAFHQMWDRVTAEFGQEDAVFFEIFNEPYGYTDEEWREVAHQWLVRYLPRIKQQNKSRILVSGSGYNENLRQVGADRRFAGCRLSFHLYAWFGGKHQSPEGWEKELAQRIGQENVSRTIVTEWGAPMKNRPMPDRLSSSSMSVDQAFLLGMSSFLRKGKMGSIYWPGLRDGDDFSLLERIGATSELRITNESGKALLRDSFGKP